MIALYIFVVVPLWAFLHIFIVCVLIVFIFNFLRKRKNKKTLSYLLFAFLPAFFGAIIYVALWFAGGMGISERQSNFNFFSIFSPEYHKFRDLCKEISGTYKYATPLIESFSNEQLDNNEKWESYETNEYILNKQGNIAQVVTMYGNQLKNKDGYVIKTSTNAITIDFIYEKSYFLAPISSNSRCLVTNEFILEKGERWLYSAFLGQLPLSYQVGYTQGNKNVLWFQKGVKTRFTEKLTKDTQ